MLETRCKPPHPLQPPRTLSLPDTPQLRSASPGPTLRNPPPSPVPLLPTIKPNSQLRKKLKRTALQGRCQRKEVVAVPLALGTRRSVTPRAHMQARRKGSFRSSQGSALRGGGWRRSRPRRGRSRGRGRHRFLFSSLLLGLDSRCLSSSPLSVMHSRFLFSSLLLGLDSRFLSSRLLSGLDSRFLSNSLLPGGLDSTFPPSSLLSIPPPSGYSLSRCKVPVPLDTGGRVLWQAPRDSRNCLPRPQSRTTSSQTWPNGLNSPKPSNTPHPPLSLSSSPRSSRSPSRLASRCGSASGCGFPS